MKTIRIKNGTKIYKIKAIVNEHIDDKGNIISTAKVDNNLYYVIDRDYFGPLYGENKNGKKNA
jgi:hypothetical protein